MGNQKAPRSKAITKCGQSKGPTIEGGGNFVNRYIVMALIVMAYIVMYSYGLYSYGPYSYGPTIEGGRDFVNHVE